jgi:hypothetical protein
MTAVISLLLGRCNRLRSWECRGSGLLAVGLQVTPSKKDSPGWNNAAIYLTFSATSTVLKGKSIERAISAYISAIVDIDTSTNLKHNVSKGGKLDIRSRTDQKKEVKNY